MSELVNALCFGPHAHDELEQGEDEGSHPRGVQHACQCSRQLLERHHEVAAVEQATIDCEEACEHSAKEPADAVDPECVESVVNRAPGVQHNDGVVANRRAQRTHHDGPHGRDEAGGGRDDDEARDGSDHGTHAGRPLRVQPFERRPHKHGRARGQVGGRDRPGGDRVGSQGRASVEAAPPEPQQRGAEEDEGHVVRPLL
mmetsp:Transcript_105249/g.297466  ORF Transcript_105249/g.297466 Transcript_105249/m.297466 type:complete len:200 (-) Transcript_105249:681-1280(-)